MHAGSVKPDAAGKAADGAGKKIHIILKFQGRGSKAVGDGSDCSIDRDTADSGLRLATVALGSLHQDFGSGRADRSAIDKAGRTQHDFVCGAYAGVVAAIVECSGNQNRGVVQIETASE